MQISLEAAFYNFTIERQIEAKSLSLSPMAGIYIHIPFCKQACHYCDFHFSTSLTYKDELLNALKQEIRFQKDFLNGDTIQTIYFGGGTPSLLNGEEISLLINTVTDLHS